MATKLDDFAAQWAAQRAAKLGDAPSGKQGVVYSTEAGRVCPGCGQPTAQCACKANAAKVVAVNLNANADGVVRVSRETKGRGGKAVTLVKGAALNAEELEALGKKLKTACGSGGTVKDGIIEVQGDHVERVVAALKARGFSAKRAGG